MATVEHFDLGAKMLHTVIGLFPFDILVIATGIKTHYLGDDNLRLGTFPLKRVPNALDLRSQILQSCETALQEINPDLLQAYLNFTIVGGGPTGGMM
jgi:NADH dehydrogenase